MKRWSHCLFLLLLLALTACQQAGDPIVLPEPAELDKIQIEHSLVPAQMKILETEENMAALIDALTDQGKKTRTESVNDNPTNVDSYYTLKFYPTDAPKSPSIAYAYEKNGKTYIEQPYAGIWEIPDAIYDEQIEVTYD